jgi:hypothetical protein
MSSTSHRQSGNVSEPSPLSTPERIVAPDGRVHTGWFARPFLDASLDGAPVRHPLAALRGTPFAAVERAYRGMRLKQWHYTSVVTDRMLFACAIVDAGYVGNAFAYVVDRATGRKHEYSVLTPGAAGIEIAPNSIDGTTRIVWPGFGRIELSNDSSRGERRIDAALEGRRLFGARPALDASILIRDDGRQPAPIVVVDEPVAGRWLYTHKCYALEAEGHVRAGDLGDAFARGKGLAGLDFNRGYRARETYWNWAAAAGRASDGTRVGWNLTAGRRPEEVPSSAGEDAGDSALWLGAECVKIGAVFFDYDAKNLMKPWRIRDAEGLVDLSFAPAGERAEDINVGLIVSRFHQPYGRFRGRLCSRTGQTFAIEDVFGVVEQHFAKW